MADLTLRLVKGSPLTNAEVDANFSNLNEAITIGGEPMGHADKTQSTLSFDAGTRTVTIAPVSGSFTVWVKGNKFVFTTAQTVVIPNTTGLHYVYFNTSGVLSTHMTYFDWPNEAPTAYVAWNATTGAAPFFGDERHGVTLDWQTHEYLHRTRGAALANGFSLGNYTVSGDGSSDAHAQLDLSGGTFFDEDMQVDIVPSNSPTPNTWEQDLTGPAQIPVLYRSGTGWVRDNPTNFVLKAGTATPRYNTESGGVWGLTDVPNNSYSAVWIIATNNLSYPVVAIMGQATDSNASQAENFDWSGLNLDGFPAVEFRPLYKIIFQCSTAYSNTIKARFTKVFDIRNLVAASPAATIGSSHGGLSGLGADDHLQYLHITEVRTPSAAVKNSLLPSQTGNNGKFLTTDGSNPSWAAVPVPNNGTLTLAVSGTGLSGSASFTADQAGNSTFTVASNATDANTANTVVARDASGNFSAGTITAALSGNATTATTLATGRTIGMTGDVTWTSGSFDGSGNVTGTATLANSGVSAGTYNNSATAVTPITFDAKGRATGTGAAVTITPAWSSITATPTTLAGYGITDAQALDADLTAIAGLTGTSGLLRKDAANTWSLDTTSYLTGNQTITVSGDASGTGATTISLTLANSGVSAGTYTKVAVDAKGRVTSGASLASSDVTTALGYTPYDSTNPSGYITNTGNARVGVENNGTLVGTRRNINFIPGSGISLTMADDAANEEVDVTIAVSAAAGVSSFNTRTGAVTLSSSDVTTALGYTPYNSSNPSGYITSAALSSYLPLGGGDMSGRIRMGTFSQSQNNTGEAWIGRAADRSTGTMTVQLGNSADRVFEVVDNAWSTVIFNAGMNSFTYKGSAVHHDGNSPRARNSDLMYYAGFTLNGNDMPTNSTGFSYSNGAPFTGPIIRTGTGGGYDMQFSASYGNSSDLAFRTRNGDAGVWNSWRRVFVEDAWQNSKYFGSDGAIYGTIFYDANNGGYYCDPNSTSRMYYLRPNMISLVNNQDNGTPRWDFKAYVVESQHHYAHSSTQTMYLGESNPVIVGGDIRSPIFYDSNNTGYYCDPNGTSRFNRLRVGDGASSWIDMLDDESPNGVKYLHANSNYLGFVSGYGGWVFRCDNGGNTIAEGNVTAYSDERLKTDWAPLAADFVDRLAEAKSGTYTRIGNGKRQAGSSAQDWLVLLPEVVEETNDEEKTLALAYGNAALVSAIELAKRVVDQEARIAKLEALIETLIGDQK